MGKQDKRDEHDDRDDDNDRPAKKKGKKEEKGANTMLLALVGGGLAVLLLCCVCGGVGGAGWHFGWFGGSKTLAKADKDADKDKDQNKDKEKNTDKDKVKDKVDPGPQKPTGTGPLVTAQNFRMAARDGNTLPKVEQILGPGLPLKGADAANAMKYPAYKIIRDLNPNGTAYQWSNSQEIYFIFFFDNGVYMGHAQSPLDNNPGPKGSTDKKKGPKGGK